MSRSDRNPGFTWRTVLASITAMVFVAVVIQFGGMTEGSVQGAALSEGANNGYGNQALATPAIWAFLGIFGVCGAVFACARRELLSRAELMCVFFATLISAPLMAHGFWRAFLPVAATLPRSADFEKLDALGDSLWPHGPNITAGLMENPDNGSDQARGHFEWLPAGSGEASEGRSVRLWNARADEVSTVRVQLAIRKDEKPILATGQAHMLNVLARARELGSEARYFCRVTFDGDGEREEEVFTANSLEKKTLLHPDGFRRVGAYGFVVPTNVVNTVEIELGLAGSGSVEFKDLRLVNVSAIEDAFVGRRTISRAGYDALSENARMGVLVRPEHLFSVEGIGYFLSGYIPLRDWIRPVCAWGSFIFILLAATYSIGVILRRQWVDSERYPLPMMRIPLALLDGTGTESQGGLGLWRRRIFWLGFITAAVWCCLRGWSQFNASIPDLNFAVIMKSYFSDPTYGKMWDKVVFSVSLVVVSLAVFMELNVLISLVVGYFLFRTEFWVGESYGFAVEKEFPYGEQQQIGAYLAYALLAVFFMRKYLTRVFTNVWPGAKRSGEAMEQRNAVFVFAACVAAVVAWSVWTGLPVRGILLFFTALVLVGFVAAKLRAECGAPSNSYFPFKLAFIIPVTGGMAVYEPDGVIFIVFTSLLIGAVSFFVIPGLQFEMIELGRRFRVRSSHVAASCALGVFGGVVIGGWFYLATCYAVGMEGFPNNAEFSIRQTEFAVYGEELATASEKRFGDPHGADVQERMDPATWGYLFAAGGTVAVTCLRQVFAGFWFHPVGFILGPSNMMNTVWGSLIFAALVRFLVLKIGGAEAVREKLFPFFVGVFLAATAVQAVFLAINTYIFFNFPGVAGFTGVF